MAIDTSIYGNIRPVEAPSYLDSAQKAATLRSLGMQQVLSQQTMADQMATRQAYASNIGADGQLDRKGVLSDLARTSPEAMQKLQEHFNKTDKDQAEAQGAQADAAHKILSTAMPVMDQLAKMPEPQRADAFPDAMKYLAGQGVPLHNVPSANGQPVYDPNWFQHTYTTAAQMKEKFDNDKTRSETAKNNAETDKIRDELGKTQPITGQSDDPAKLVAGRVPKQHQAKALEEIKNAEDIRALTPKILTAFEMGSSRNPIVAAQGQREFEGLMNTTVKDQEGTARQAAFDSIHKAMTPSGLLASPGENEAKRRTVLEYLQSKTSAPTARAYGVDLAKFDSTAPFKPADKKAAEDGTAYAADAPKAPAQPPAGTIRMQAPDGSIRYVPASQKGEAIAAGGKVLK